MNFSQISILLSSNVLRTQLTSSSSRQCLWQCKGAMQLLYWVQLENIPCCKIVHVLITDFANNYVFSLFYSLFHVFVCTLSSEDDRTALCTPRCYDDSDGCSISVVFSFLSTFLFLVFVSILKCVFFFK